MKDPKFIQKNLLGLMTVTALASLGYAQIGATLTNESDPRVIRHGEILVKNNLIEVEGSQTIEVEGVCKLEANGANCWKPDGSANPGLTDTVSKSIRQMDDENYRTFPVSHKRKYRFLVLKDMRLQRNRGAQKYGEYFAWRNSNGGNTEGWTQVSSALNSTNSTGFDGSHTTMTVYEGVFEKETKEFPFRYAFRSINSRNITIPVKTGPFEVDGNKFELVSITDSKVEKIANPRNGNFGYGYYFPPRTEMVFKTVSKDDPYSFSTLYLADDKGNPISYVTKKGVPVANTIAQKWTSDHQNLRPDERERKSPYVDAGAIYLDPYNYNSAIGSTQTMRLNIAKEHAKNFIVSIGKREVYVFDKVRLDPN